MYPLMLDHYQEVVQRISRCVARLSLRPEYPLQMVLNQSSSMALTVQWTAQDSRSPHRLEAPISGTFHIPYLRTDTEAFLWLRACMQSVVLHELDEFLRLDGNTVFDPHEGLRRSQPDDSIPALLGMAVQDHGLQLQVQRHLAVHEGRGHDPFSPEALFRDSRLPRVPEYLEQHTHTGFDPILNIVRVNLRGA